MLQVRQFIGLLLIILLASCGADINEEYRLKADGSGTYQVQGDMVPFMRAMMYTFEGMTDEKGKKKSIDSAKIERRLFKDLPDRLDSISSFEELLKEDIEKNPDMRSFAKNGYLFMRGGRMEKKMICGIHYSFKTIEQLNSLHGLMQEKNRKNQLSQGIPLETNVSYNLNNTTFERTYKKMNQRADSKDKTNDEVLANMIFDKVVYRTKVYTERKIKNVTGDALVFRSDSLLIFEYPMKEYMQGAISQDFKIEFE